MFGVVLGVVALAIVAAGLLGWTALLEPIGRFVPGQATSVVPAVKTATFALAVLIAAKWLVATGMAAAAR